MHSMKIMNEPKLKLVFINPYSANTTKVVYFSRLLKCFEASLTSSVDQDQTAPIRVHTVFLYTNIKAAYSATFIKTD